MHSDGPGNEAFYQDSALFDESLKALFEEMVKRVGCIRGRAKDWYDLTQIYTSGKYEKYHEHATSISIGLA